MKSALVRHFELALHGFQIGIFNPKIDLLGHDQNEPKADFILGHPAYFTCKFN